MRRLVFRNGVLRQALVECAALTERLAYSLLQSLHLLMHIDWQPHGRNYSGAAMSLPTEMGREY